MDESRLGRTALSRSVLGSSWEVTVGVAVSIIASFLVAYLTVSAKSPDPEDIARSFTRAQAAEAAQSQGLQTMADQLAWLVQDDFDRRLSESAITGTVIGGTAETGPTLPGDDSNAVSRVPAEFPALDTEEIAIDGLSDTGLNLIVVAACVVVILAGVVARYLSFRRKDQQLAEMAARRGAASEGSPLDLLGAVADAQVAAGHPKCVRVLGLQGSPSTTLVASIEDGEVNSVLSEVMARVPKAAPEPDGSWLLGLDESSPAVVRLVVERVDTLPTAKA